MIIWQYTGNYFNCFLSMAPATRNNAPGCKSDKMNCCSALLNRCEPVSRCATESVISSINVHSKTSIMEENIDNLQLRSVAEFRLIHISRYYTNNKVVHTHKSVSYTHLTLPTNREV